MDLREIVILHSGNPVENQCPVTFIRCKLEIGVCFTRDVVSVRGNHPSCLVFVFYNFCVMVILHLRTIWFNTIGYAVKIINCDIAAIRTTGAGYTQHICAFLHARAKSHAHPRVLLAFNSPFKSRLIL